LLAGTATPSQSNSPAATLTVIRAGSLIDGTSDAPRKNQLIFVRGKHIEKIADASAAIPAGATIIDLSSSTALPGLIDSTRTFSLGRRPRQGRLRREHSESRHRPARCARYVSRFAALSSRGFTTLRDVETEGAGYGDVEIKEAIAEGTIPGPRLFVVTRAISSTGGYNLEGYAPELVMPKGAQIIDGPVEARKAAREQLEHGADWIKVYMTHRSWVDKQGNLVSQPTLTVEELKAIVDETHGWGKKSSVPCLQRNRDATRAGWRLRLDEHGLEITDAQMAQMARQGTWYCPTLSPYYDDWAPADTPDGKRDRARAAVHEITFRKALQPI